MIELPRTGLFVLTKEVIDRMNVEPGGWVHLMVEGHVDGTTACWVNRKGPDDPPDFIGGVVDGDPA